MEQVESGTFVHLPCEHLDTFTWPCTAPGTVRQGQSLQDGIVVGVEPSGKAAQVRQDNCRDR